MSTRRGRDEGGIHWDDDKQRWVATVTVGYRPNGKRIVRKRLRKTKTEVRVALRELLDELADGNVAPQDYDVAHAVRDWLAKGLKNRDDDTIVKLTFLSEKHIFRVERFAATRIARLEVDQMDEWLADRAQYLGNRAMQDLLSIVRRSLDFAIRRRKAKYNVARLCEVPRGQKPGRPSKSLTSEQAAAVIEAAEADDSVIGDYTVVSLLTGARTEEMRKLGWDLVDRQGDPTAAPPVPPWIAVWRSVREHGDTKTRQSRRTLALPKRAVLALNRQEDRQARQRARAGKKWQATGLVFASTVGTKLDAANVRRGFRRIVKIAGLEPKEWTPRELRHSFVSILSDNDVPLEKIALLAGHASTKTTEIVYRHQLRPVLRHGAEILDSVLPLDRLESGSES